MLLLLLLRTAAAAIATHPPNGFLGLDIHGRSDHCRCAKLGNKMQHKLQQVKQPRRLPTLLLGMRRELLQTLLTLFDAYVKKISSRFKRA